MAANQTVAQPGQVQSSWSKEMERNEKALSRTEQLVDQLCDRLGMCSVEQPPAKSPEVAETEQGSRLTSEIANQSRRLEKLNAVLEDQLSRLQI